MEITYTEQKKRAKEKTDVYIGGEYRFTLCDETIMKYGVVTGAEFDEAELEKIKEESDALWAFECGLQAVCRALVTEKALRRKLKLKNFSDNAVSAAVEKLKSYGYLDDTEYARAFIESASKRKGARKILQELKVKGVSEEVANELIKGLDENEAAWRFAEKFAATKGVSTREDRDKLARAMQYRGFSWDSISSCVQRLKDVDD